MASITKQYNLLSAMLFSYQSEERIAATIEKLITSFEDEKIPFELIIIDDGSTDKSFQIATQIASTDERINAYQLSKNYGVISAHFAALSLSKGACAVTIPDDLERPIDTIIHMYRLWEKGSKIIIGCRKKRADKWSAKIFSAIYFKIINSITEVNLPKGGADGWFIDREIIDIVNERISPTNTSSLIEILRLGFEPTYFYYDRPHLNNKSRWTFKKKKKFFLDSLYASSSFPIKFISFLGFSISIICLILIILIFIGKLFINNSLFGFPIPGWATLLTFITLFNGLILLSLGIVAEYIWRIYEEVKNRPPYIIKKDGGDD